MISRTIFATSLAFTMLSIALAQTTEQRSTLAEHQDVAVTIYNDNLALVKDHRKIAIKSGASSLAFRDVSAKILAETAQMRSLSSPGKLTVLEQNFDFDLLTPQQLLEKYVGRQVTIVHSNPTTGAETSETATVLSANNGVVLQIGQRIETGLSGRIVYDDVPPNLRDRPTLVMTLENKGSPEQDVELSYLTSGLGWKADYVVALNPTDDKLDISGWVTLTNKSGTSYNNAKLQLVAGDVHRARQVAGAVFKLATPMPAPVARASMSEEALFEYHLYSLDRQTTIAENQTKQVALLTGANVPMRKVLILSGSDYYYQTNSGNLGQKLKVSAFVDFDNKESAHLGLPMPTGVVRVYKKDSAGNTQFIGEDNIDHTPKNETLRLKLGESFDVTADKKQISFAKFGGTGKYKNIYESAYEIVLKNAKKEAVTVTVQEPIPGDWQMLNESQGHTKPVSNTAVWQVSIPAEGTTTLTYRVRVNS